ncbi:Structural maintenance of chromosomes protein 5 [Escovopsis weberi]|uniref:Structural maintenance of chromosomes protein 5 n=1 Tax=Escovopsis weberi TaxID=150374 RepID=A0A0M8MV05_ESCWE|nr:Structural maintenance of chromosomes protein 5 [Escovopsis weberi]
MTNFQPGAIVRVSVENFVTYEQADFYPGPHLNMIIGPNGVGKSTLVCAICLGLGYTPKLLGRASTIKEFIRLNKNRATIEIELQKRPGDQSNYVVKVLIRSDQSALKWWLNGEETTQKKILEVGQKLKLQVDNLCQFLPQDRVAEFANSTPVALLHETLRAAAPQKVRDEHEQLQNLHKERKHITESLDSDKERLENLQTRQAGLQADVDRLRERQVIQERVENLEGALVCARYQEARNKFEAAKSRQQQAAAALLRYEREVQPSLEAVNQKEVYVNAIKPVIRARAQKLKEAQAAAQQMAEEVRAAADKIQECDNGIAAERQGFDAKKKALSAAKTKITSLQADLRNQPDPFEPTAWNQKIRAEEHISRDIEADLVRLRGEIHNLHTDGKANKDETQRLRKNIDELDTKEGQQLSFIKSKYPEVARGWEWISENQDHFEKEVFGPPIITCSLKDERYSNQIQSFLQHDDFLCFTAQTKNDYKKLSDQFYRMMSLSVNIRTCFKPLSSFRSPVSAEEANSLSLDGFAIDYLQGPEPVLAMLCAEKRLHLSGLSLNEHSEAEYERLAHHATISTWAAGVQSYAIRRRREYGPQAMSAVTRGIQPGQFWTSQPNVATQERLELQRRLEEAKSELDEMKTKHKALSARKNELEEQKSKVEEKISDLKNEKNTLQREYQKWLAIPTKISAEEATKFATEEQMAAARQKISDLSFEGDRLAVERAKLAIRHLDAIDEIRDAHRGLLQANMRLIEAESDVVGLKERNKAVMEKLEEQKTASREAAAEKASAKEAATELRRQASEHMNSEAKKEILNELMQGKTADEIEHELNADKASLELIHAANPNAIREYEKREAEIAKVAKQLEGRNGKLGELDTQLRELMDSWEPRVDALVNEINNAFAYNFEQISCAGEVRIHKDEDFDQWALQIMVKFREYETLQQLNAHRQSGGERAVSTVFFLMALQSLAQSPFRVVDEINQGMDPRNERMVHERMVEIACREHTSQYFLVTPKLLTGLRYDARMRVLCIASGEHMPADGRRLDFRRCLDAHHARIVASA